MRSSALATTISALVFIATAITSPAQTLTTLHNFDATYGYTPLALMQATDGNLYGTTAAGGANLKLCDGYGCGTIFRISTDGNFDSMFSLDGKNGAGPYGYSLIQATNGDLYGTAQAGGNKSSLCNGPTCGTLFRISLAGDFQALYDFCSEANCADGSNPFTGLVQATNGEIYGTTNWAGAPPVGEPGNVGTVFEVGLSGGLTTLHSFCSQPNCADGLNPATALIQASNGYLYGTTSSTIFKMTLAGDLTTLYTFVCAQANNCCPPPNGCPNGIVPVGFLIQGNDGNLYGGTEYGGDASCTYRQQQTIPGCGTIFRMTLGGTLTTVHTFSFTDGAEAGQMIQGSDGNFYGVTFSGGANGDGTIFEMTPKDTLTTLYNFCSQTNCADGNTPEWLLQDTDGNFYGNTYEGGTGTNSACGSLGCGTLYSFSVGLGPFVETQTTLGKVGSSVIILGTNLTGATSVTFNGTSATFTVVSSSEIEATVPTGATSGRVQVTTPSGVLTSNTIFYVQP
jgi:uncharacterized repeat protein (TIGR03803 family)